MNTPGFYKIENNQVIYEQKLVCGLGYVLLDAEKDSYTYPVDGWIWAESLDSAMAEFLKAGLSTDGYTVQPENFTLDTSRDSETEFNKLITLVQLALNTNSLTNDTLVKIKDISGGVHEITVSRFLEIMVGYGFHCYQSRNY